VEEALQKEKNNLRLAEQRKEEEAKQAELNAIAAKEAIEIEKCKTFLQGKSYTVTAPAGGRRTRRQRQKQKRKTRARR
jgi:hypothetical protein